MTLSFLVREQKGGERVGVRPITRTNREKRRYRISGRYIDPETRADDKRRRRNARRRR